MWPFNRKRPGVEDGLRSFASYLSPEAVKAIAEGRPMEPSPLEQGEIPFVLLQVRDDEAEQIRARLARAMTRIHDSHGIADMMSSVVFVFFGYPRNSWASALEKPSIENSRRLSVALQQELGADVKVLYGTATGLVGSLGGPHRLHYGAAIPNFGALMARLTQLEFGRVETL